MLSQLEEFRIYYNHTIHPELMRLEGKRKRLLFLLFMSAIVLVILILFEIWLDIFLVAMYLAVPIVGYVFYLFYQVRNFTKTFKPKIVNLIIDFIDNGVNYGDMTYEQKRFIAKKDFVNSGLFVGGLDVYQGEDFIQGSIGDVDYELSELNVREYSKVRSRLNYVFRGVFLKATVREGVGGTIIILPEQFRQYLERSIRAVLKKGARDIEGFLRNEDFRDTFMVYATRDAQLKDFLTDEMMDAILDYRDKTGKEIYISMKRNNIYLAVTEPKDLLEPFIFRSNVSFELVRGFFEDITLLLSIVEDFDIQH